MTEPAEQRHQNPDAGPSRNLAQPWKTLTSLVQNVIWILASLAGR